MLLLDVTGSQDLHDTGLLGIVEKRNSRVERHF